MVKILLRHPQYNNCFLGGTITGISPSSYVNFTVYCNRLCRKKYGQGSYFLPIEFYEIFFRSTVLMAVIVSTSYYLDRNRSGITIVPTTTTTTVDTLLRLSWPLQRQCINIIIIYTAPTDRLYIIYSIHLFIWTFFFFLKFNFQCYVTFQQLQTNRRRLHQLFSRGKSTSL